MDFAGFEKAIKAAPLKQVARLWNEVRGSRAMPDWSDIRPSRISQQLSIIWSYRYDRDADAFTGRLAGDQIERVIGKTFRGTPMTDLYPPDRIGWIHDHFRRVAREPALFLQKGKVFKLVDHYGFGERIALPLAKDGVHGDGIFGATVYETFRAMHAQPHPDTELWYPLQTVSSESADDAGSLCRAGLAG